MSKQLSLPGFGVDLSEKAEEAIKLLRRQERLAIDHSPDGYYGCFSGGKDSVVIKHLAGVAGVKATWHYNCTTIDPPEIYRFIRHEHPDVIWHRPKQGFFEILAEQRGYPTRINRWCCQELKESAGAGEVKIIGVRWAESVSRRRWQPVHWFDMGEKSSWMVSPILTWKDEDVWRYIRENDIAYCCLYDEGFTRLGCVGCPMAMRKGKEMEFARWPQYKRAWLRAFRRLWNRRRDTVLTRGSRKGAQWPGIDVNTPEELFEWWVAGDRYLDEPNNSCQLGLW